MVGDPRVLLHVVFPLLLLIQVVRNLHVLFQDLHFLLLHLPLLNLLVLLRVLGAQQFSLLFDRQVSSTVQTVFLESFRSVSLLFEDGLGAVFVVRPSGFYAFGSCGPFLLLFGVPVPLFLELGLLELGQFLLLHTEVVDEQVETVLVLLLPGLDKVVES